ncbi:MAG: hypothetical protein M3Y74_17720 [Chloroflexota bacterium]|nr:hypothetical protein [Chloroflexota bacterium]
MTFSWRPSHTTFSRAVSPMGVYLLGAPASSRHTVVTTAFATTNTCAGDGLPAGSWRSQ